MRTARVLAAAGLLGLLLSTSAAAQVRDEFRNSWFWGAKAGIASLGTAIDESSQLDQIGGEWLLTRNRGALYLAYDQASFDRSTQLADSRGQVFNIAASDSRRFTAALLAFPFRVGFVRPYGGVGLALNLIRSAAVISPLPPPDSDIGARLVDARDRAAVLAMLGAQAQVGRLAIFAQGTGMPTASNFLLGAHPTYFVEAGVRVNVAPSFTRY